jgi:hypothetical protein
MLCALKRYCLIPSGSRRKRSSQRRATTAIAWQRKYAHTSGFPAWLAQTSDLARHGCVPRPAGRECRQRVETQTTRQREDLGQTFLYIQRKANPSRAHPAVASAQNTPATMWPPVKREMRLISPAEPDEGIPMNLGFLSRESAVACDALRRGLSRDLHVGAEGDVECTEQEERVEKEAISAGHVDQSLESTTQDKDCEQLTLSRKRCTRGGLEGSFLSTSQARTSSWERNAHHRRNDNAPITGTYIIAAPRSVPRVEAPSAFRRSRSRRTSESKQTRAAVGCARDEEQDGADQVDDERQDEEHPDAVDGGHGRLVCLRDLVSGVSKGVQGSGVPDLKECGRGTHSMLWKSKGKGPGGQLLRPLRAWSASVACVS